MRFIKQSFRVCLQNFRKWTTDYRIWILAILLLILVHENVRNLSDISAELGIKSTLWSFPFLYSQYHMKLIFTLPLLILFCNAPFADKNTLLVLARSGRGAWITGQILYIAISSAVYYLFLFLCTVLLSLPSADWTTEWGKLIYTLAYTGAAGEAGHHFIQVSGFVITYFTPLQAVWFTFLLSWLSAVMLGLIVCGFNVLTNTKYIGCAASGIVIVFSCFVSVFGGNRLLPYSPVSWITLDQIDVGGFTEHPSFSYCIGVYLVILTGLIIVNALGGRRFNINIS